MQTINTNTIESAIDIARTISDSTRIKILLALSENGEICVYEISEIVKATQSATSHQLSKLESKGLVRGYRDGQRMCYELTKTPETKKVLQCLKALGI